MTIIPLSIRLPNESDSRLGDPMTTVWVREGTSDEDVVRECFTDDVYHLRGLDLGEQPRIIDVGACSGIFTVQALQMFPTAVVESVEPDAENYALLCRNTEPWWFPASRSIPIRAAVGGDERRVVVVGSGARGHTVRTDSETNPDNVEQITLETLICSPVRQVALLKMDVEGAEYDAIAACSPDVLTLVERIHMEWHGTSEAPWVTDAPARYGELLTKLAYTHTVQTFGRPDQGGYLFATRY